jgi:hypothetical protein
MLWRVQNAFLKKKNGRLNRSRGWKGANDWDLGGKGGGRGWGGRNSTGDVKKAEQEWEWDGKKGHACVLKKRL